MRLVNFLNKTRIQDANDFTLAETRLFELRNILNTDEITNWADNAADGVANRLAYGQPAVQNTIHLWLSKALRKYILTKVRGNKVQLGDDGETAYYSKDGGQIALVKDMPPWAQKALLAGNELEVVNPASVTIGRNVPKEVNLVRDWLRHKLSTTPEQITPSRLSRISFENAIKLSDDYHKELERKRPASEQEVKIWYHGDDSDELDKWNYLEHREKQKIYKEFTKATGRPVAGVEDTPEHHVVVKEYQDGSKWVSLTTQSCLDYEGNMMGNCVASYGEDVEAEEARIYSYRDNKNIPHVTIEKDADVGGAIAQIKGKGNEPPIPKYYPYVIDLMNYIYDEEGSIMTNEEGDEDLGKMGMIHDTSSDWVGLSRSPGAASTGTILAISPPFDHESFGYQTIDYKDTDEYGEHTDDPSEQTQEVKTSGIGSLDTAMNEIAGEYAQLMAGDKEYVLSDIIKNGKWEEEDEELRYDGSTTISTIWYAGDDKNIKREFKVVVPSKPSK